MSVGFVLVRVLHVVLGVFWAGTLVFNALFLGPAIAEAGPDGAKVMGGIIRRRFMDIMPVVALVTILTGLWMYWQHSGGFRGGWAGSPMGIGFGTGGVLAIIAFVIGVSVLRPAMAQIGQLAARAGQSGDAAERDALMAQVGGLRKHATAAGRWVAVLLALATVAMGVARYL